MKSQPDLASFTRRSLLGGSASRAAASALSRTTRAAGVPTKPVLVQVFLRGAMDGLTSVVPYGDGDLYNLRPTLAVAPPGNPNGAVDLDGFFGLAPTAAPLLTPYGNGHLAVIHATGSIDATRSHFEAYERMELADHGLPQGAITSGWAARYLEATAASATSELRGIGIGTILPLTLSEAPLTIPVDDFHIDFPGIPGTSLLREEALVDAYSRRPPAIAAPALDIIAAFEVLGIDTANYVPENGAVYPGGEFGRRMRDIAALIKTGMGVEVISIDYGNWDLHVNLGPTNGEMAQQLNVLSRGLEAFYLDMLGRMDEYVLVALSEFGRHVRENASAGTDHGHGNAMFVLGDVNGGQVYAQWPGLSPAALDAGDVAITTDYRDVLSDVLVGRLGVTDLAPIFPNHTYTPVGVV
jgi:uncharacterized protein (DUF1501 family)